MPIPQFLYGELTYQVIACAFEVHKVLAPGLLENAYKACMARELDLKGLPYTAEVSIPLQYKGAMLETGYRADLIVDGNLTEAIHSLTLLFSA